MTDDDRRERMPPELTRTLMEYSPRLRIAAPTLVRTTDSPTGWLVVIPDTEEHIAELHAGDPRVSRRPSGGPGRTGP